MMDVFSLMVCISIMMVVVFSLISGIFQEIKATPLALLFITSNYISSLSPLRKHSKFDNQPFFTLHPKGKRLIINEVETKFLIFCNSKTFRSGLIIKIKDTHYKKEAHFMIHFTKWTSSGYLL